MTYGYRWLFAALSAFLVLTVGVVCAQELDKDEPAAPKEEPVIEELLLEELPLEGVAGDKVERPAEKASATEEVVTEEVVEEEAEEAVIIEEPVEEPLKEVVEEPVKEVTEEIIEEPVKEVVEEEAEEAVIEEPVEEPLKEVVEEPVEEVTEEIIEEAVEGIVEKGAPVEAVEELTAKELVEDLVKEEASLIEAEAKAGPSIPAVPIKEVAEKPIKAVIEEPVEEPFEEAVWEPAEVTVEKGAPVEAVEELTAKELVEDLVKEEASLVEAEAKAGPPIAAVPKKKRDLKAALIADIVTQEALRRQALQDYIKTTLESAKEKLREKRYEAAATMYQQALRYIPEFAPEKKVAEKGLAESYYQRALFLEGQGEYKTALDVAKDAANYGHPKGEKLMTRLRSLIEKPPTPPPPPIPARWDEKEYKDKETQISSLLKTGREHFMAGEYDKAQEYYESVLKMNPLNSEAIRLMEKIAQKKYDRATMELEATRKDMMSDVRRAWNPRDYASIERLKRKEGLRPVTRISEAETERMKIEKKMDNIIIPEIEFRQANINDVIGFLQQASVQFDTSEEIEGKKGVNIILNLQYGAAPVKAGVAEFGEFAPEPVAEGIGVREVPLITFTARYISLLDALKLVTDVAGLKYRIGHRVVMIIPLDAPEGDIIVRTYRVLPSVEEKIPAMRTELGAEGRGGAGGGEFIAMEAGAGVKGTDWKDFFASMGVKWPEGSSIKYVRSIGKLVVANTEDNLTVFEKVLAELNVVPTQIEIESRFVEISKSDMSSLGLEWLLTDEWEVLQKKGSMGVPLSLRERIVVKANVAAGGFTKGNRFLSQPMAAGVTMGTADDLFSIAWVLTNPELSLILHMIEQSGNADMLSAPKVLAQAGQEATIKVVTEYIYPTEFTVTPITVALPGGGSTIAGGVVEPGGFETREVGVLLTVLPDVSAEGQMITLAMTPQVVSEPEWKNYGSTYIDPNGNAQQLTMEQPFFHTRSISTSVSIYNNATVVMGGMITEERSNVDDKIPFLGDIPVLGRLFRSKYESSAKRNLLIFVTARLVDPAGRPVEESGEMIADRLTEAAAAPARP